MVERGVFCTACTWSTGGAREGRWCGCCWVWEGDRPRPVGTVETHLRWRCPARGRRETTTDLLSHDDVPTRTCTCGTPQGIEGRRYEPHTRDGVDALYGLPFYLGAPCAGHTL